MSKTNPNFIDSHWLIFVLKGAVALVFGWLFLFNSGNSFTTIASIVGLFLLALSVVEFFNALYRAHNRYGWFISVLIALFDSIAALILLFTLKGNLTVPFITIAVYTFLRGLAEIFFGFRTIDDSTDRFIWILTGVCGTIMGIVIFNSGHLDTVAFIRFFGAYILVLGVSNLIYGIHNRAQKLDAINEKKSSKLPQKAKKPQKSVKKSKSRR